MYVVSTTSVVFTQAILKKIGIFFVKINKALKIRALLKNVSGYWYFIIL